MCSVTTRKNSSPISYEHSPSPARRASLGKRTSQCPRAAPSGKEGGYSIQSIQGVAGIHNEVSTAAGTAKQQGETRTGPGSVVVARVARSHNALKRGRAQDMGGGVQSQRPRKLVRASARKSSLSISAQPLELVVISDPEPEAEDHDDP